MDTEYNKKTKLFLSLLIVAACILFAEFNGAVYGFSEIWPLYVMLSGELVLFCCEYYSLDMIYKSFLKLGLNTWTLLFSIVISFLFMLSIENTLISRNAQLILQAALSISYLICVLCSLFYSSQKEKTDKRGIIAVANEKITVLTQRLKIKSAVFVKLKKVVAVLTIVFLVIGMIYCAVAFVYLPSVYNKGLRLIEEGNYEEATGVFTTLSELCGYRDSDTQLIEIKYLTALRHYEAGEYRDSANRFREIKDYKDSYEMYIESTYEQALVYTKQGNYEAAYNLYSSIYEYKDTEQKMIEVKYQLAKQEYDDKQYSMAAQNFIECGSYSNAAEMARECFYQCGVELYSDKRYEAACKWFIRCGDYKDSEALILRIQLHTIKYAFKDAEVLFGRYEQDGNPDNGAEIISWYVESYENGKLTLICSCILDSRAYLNDGTKPASWDISDLRQWLNGSFYNEAFNENEKKYIVATRLSNPDNPETLTGGCEDTTDKVFVPSLMEMEKYSLRKSASLSDYMLMKHGYDKGDYRTTNYILRSPGENPYMIKNSKGYSDATDDEVYIRPMINVYVAPDEIDAILGE